MLKCRFIFSVAVPLATVAPLGAQPWKCGNPERPLRFADTEESRESQTPPCQAWIDLRAPNLGALLAAYGSQRFTAANEFLAQVDTFGIFDYPAFPQGAAVPTTTLYSTPEEFGFREMSLQEAPLGSLVVYDGLAGILIETRDSASAPWERKVLYPSAARNFELNIADVTIPGEAAPKVLVSGGRDPITDGRSSRGRPPQLNSPKL